MVFLRGGGGKQKISVYIARHTRVHVAISGLKEKSNTMLLSDSKNMGSLFKLEGYRRQPLRRETSHHDDDDG